MISPFQGLFPAEIAENANSSINIFTERSQLMENSNGYSLILHAVITVHIYKLVVIVSVDTSQSVPPAQWDSETRNALSHRSFEPFVWPEMSSETPTLVDLKIKVGENILGRMEFVAYRTELDMSVTRCQFNQAAVQLLKPARQCHDPVLRLSGLQDLGSSGRARWSHVSARTKRHCRGHRPCSNPHRDPKSCSELCRCIRQ